MHRVPAAKHLLINEKKREASVRQMFVHFYFAKLVVAAYGTNLKSFKTKSSVNGFLVFRKFFKNFSSNIGKSFLINRLKMIHDSQPQAFTWLPAGKKWKIASTIEPRQKQFLDSFITRLPCKNANRKTKQNQNEKNCWAHSLVIRQAKKKETDKLRNMLTHISEGLFLLFLLQFPITSVAKKNEL